MKNPLSVRLSVFPVALWVIATGCLSMVADDAEEAQRRELHQYLKGRYLFQKQMCHLPRHGGQGRWSVGGGTFR